MSSGKDAARDTRHGRRGGGWIPDGASLETVGAQAKRAKKCQLCRRPMLLGQRGAHAVCTSIKHAFPEHWSALLKDHPTLAGDADENAGA